MCGWTWLTSSGKHQNVSAGTFLMPKMNIQHDEMKKSSRHSLFYLTAHCFRNIRLLFYYFSHKNCHQVPNRIWVINHQNAIIRYNRYLFLAWACCPVYVCVLNICVLNSFTKLTTTEILVCIKTNCFRQCIYCAYPN